MILLVAAEKSYGDHLRYETSIAFAQRQSRLAASTLPVLSTVGTAVRSGDEQSVVADDHASVGEDLELRVTGVERSADENV